MHLGSSLQAGTKNIDLRRSHPLPPEKGSRISVFPSFTKTLWVENDLTPWNQQLNQMNDGQEKACIPELKEICIVRNLKLLPKSSNT